MSVKTDDRVNDPAHLVQQAHLCKALLAADVSDAIGAACSYLLYAAHAHPHVVRRVLSEPVVREGFRGIPLIQILTRIAR